MCNVNESPGNVIYCNLYAWCVFLYGLNFKSMDKHSFLIALGILCLLPVSLFSRSRVVNDTIFSKKLNADRAYSVYLPPSYGEVPGKNIRCFIFFMECRKLIKTGYGADMCRR